MSWQNPTDVLLGPGSPTPAAAADALWQSAGQAAKHRQHIVGTAADYWVWDDAVTGAETVAQLVRSHPEWPTWPELLQDVFRTFYKMTPTLQDPEMLDPDVAANRPYVERLLQEPATEETRVQTRLDELASLLATVDAGRKLAEQIAANADLNQALQQQQPPPPTIQGAVSKIVRSASRAGTQAAADAQAQLIQWGLGADALQSLPIGERLALVERLQTPRFRQLAAQIGRLRALARYRQGAALRHDRDEIYRLRLGGELPFVLPQELALLGDPWRAWDFGRRLLEHQLLEYDMKPKRRQILGPLLVALDCSSSMHGDRITWAVGVALALADTARRQRRSAGLVAFNEAIQREFIWPRGAVPPEQLMDLAGLDAAGGTNFDRPIRWALDQIRQAPAFHRADIVLITDGECDLNPDTLDALNHARRQGVRVLSILIGGTPLTLQQWSDLLWTIQNPDDDVAGELFAALVPGT